MRVVTIGNAIIDYYVDLEKRFPGGSALNVAVYSKEFGAKKSSFIGVIGDDIEGKHIINTLSKHQIDSSKVRQHHGRTGKVYITLNSNNDREIGKWEKGVLAKKEIELNSDDIEFINNHELLHVGLNSGVSHLLEKLAKKIKISFDFSTEKDKHLLKQIAPYLHIAFLSCSEMDIDEIKGLGDYIHELGTNHVFLTRGEKGSVYFGENGFFIHDIEETFDVVDTLGAGDTFVAFCLSHLSQGSDIKKLLLEASRNATETCRVLGGFGEPL